MKDFTTYQLKESMFSMTDNYTVYDEQGDKAYSIKGSFFSWGDNLSLEDASGNKLLTIDQKKIALRPTYILYRGDEKLAKVKKKIGLLKQKLEIDLPEGKDYTVKGNFLAKEFEFYRGRQKVAEVSKSWFSMTDNYGVRVATDEDHELIMATVIIIDLIMQAEEKEE